MSGARSESGPLILDACVLINLLATGMADEIIDVQEHSSVICRQVAAEALVLDQPDGPRIRVHPENLPVVDLRSDDEYDHFVRLAMELGDGEAATIALARSRGYVVLTDDRKATRIAGEQGVATFDTVDLLRTWAGLKDDDAVVDAIARIEQRARFRPRGTHQHASWWSDAASRGAAQPRLYAGDVPSPR